MNVLETKTVRTEVSKRIELSDVDLRRLIKAATGDEVPILAEIFVEIPGGGYWSNTSLDISDSPVVITWTEVTES